MGALGKEFMQIQDPLRHKIVPLTPEEEVRQWFIATLHDSLGVPLGLMGSEVSFDYCGKKYRADIVVYSRQGTPIAVVECKRPEVKIDAEVVRQAMRYNAVLDVHYIFLTNGKSTCLYLRQGDIFVPSPSIVKYDEMR